MTEQNYESKTLEELDAEGVPHRETGRHWPVSKTRQNYQLLAFVLLQAAISTPIGPPVYRGCVAPAQTASG